MKSQNHSVFVAVVVLPGSYWRGSKEFFAVTVSMEGPSTDYLLAESRSLVLMCWILFRLYSGLIFVNFEAKKLRRILLFVQAEAVTCLK